jgi:hypothetical protein
MASNIVVPNAADTSDIIPSPTITNSTDNDIDKIEFVLEGVGDDVEGAPNDTVDVGLGDTDEPSEGLDEDERDCDCQRLRDAD